MAQAAALLPLADAKCSMITWRYNVTLFVHRASEVSEFKKHK